MKKFILAVTSVFMILITSLVSISACDSSSSEGCSYNERYQLYVDLDKSAWDVTKDVLNYVNLIYNFDEKLHVPDEILNRNVPLAKMFGECLTWIKENHGGGMLEVALFAISRLRKKCVNLQLAFFTNSPGLPNLSERDSYLPVVTFVTEKEGERYIIDMWHYHEHAKETKNMWDCPWETLGSYLSRTEFPYFLVLKEFPGDVKLPFGALTSGKDYDVFDVEKNRYL